MGAKYIYRLLCHTVFWPLGDIYGWYISQFTHWQVWQKVNLWPWLNKQKNQAGQTDCQLSCCPWLTAWCRLLKNECWQLLEITSAHPQALINIIFGFQPARILRQMSVGQHVRLSFSLVNSGQEEVKAIHTKNPPECRNQLTLLQ